MASTALRDNNEVHNASKDSAGEMQNGNQKPKAKTTKGDKFRGSDDEGPPTNTEPILVKKTKKSKRASAAPRATEVLQPRAQANSDNWDESHASVEVRDEQERFATRPTMLAPRTATTNQRFPQQQQAGLERTQQRQQQRPFRRQQPVAQPRPPEQQPRDARQQLEAPQKDDGDSSENTWHGEDSPNRVISEDVMDNVHARLDKLTWDKKPSAGPSFRAGTTSTFSARGGTSGFGPMSAQLDSYIDNCIYQSNRRLPEHVPQHTNPTHQNSSRNQNAVDGHGLRQPSAQPTNYGPPRNAQFHVNPNTPNPPSWSASASAQWGPANVNSWDISGWNANYEHNGHMTIPNLQTNGSAPQQPQANFGASGSMGNTSNAALQPPQTLRSTFPVSRAAAVPRRNGFGEYRGPTMRVLRRNGVDKLVRDGGRR